MRVWKNKQDKREATASNLEFSLLCEENFRIGIVNESLAVTHARVWLDGQTSREVYVKPPFFVRILNFDLHVSAVENQDKLYAIRSTSKTQNVLLKSRVWFGRGAEIIPAQLGCINHISRKHFSMELAFLGSQKTQYVLVTGLSKNGSLVFPEDEASPMVIPGVRFKFSPRIDGVGQPQQLQQLLWTCERKDSKELTDRTITLEGNSDDLVSGSSTTM